MKSLLTILTTIFCIGALAQAPDPAQVVKPFSTDQCTGYWEGTRSGPQVWAHCCIEHDLFMWAGGTKKNRSAADKNLKACIRETGHPYHARLVFLGVKIGSYSPIKIKEKKWSNAWLTKRKNRPLTSEEIDLLELSLISSSPDDYLNEKMISAFLNKLRTRRN